MASINYIAADALPRSYSSIPHAISAAFIEHQEAVKQRLQRSLSRIHFSIDIWTSPNKIGFQAICCHFVDADTRSLRKCLLALKPHGAFHGGEPQAKAFLEVVERYGITYNVGHCTTDNGSSNNTLLRAIAEAIPTFDEVLHRVRCLGHVLNITIQAFLFAEDKEASEEAIRQWETLSIQERLGEQPYHQTARQFRKLGPIGKAHNFVLFIHSSEQRLYKWKEFAREVIPRDNDTRWNSWYLMLEALIRLRSYTAAWMEEYADEVPNDLITREEWEDLIEMRDFLRPFYRVTKRFEGDFGTLDSALTSMDFLVSHFNTSKERYKKRLDINRRIQIAWRKFDCYYLATDWTPAYVNAILLYPGLRAQYLDHAWAHQKQYIRPAIAKACALWTEQYKPTVSVNVTIEAEDEYDHWNSLIYKSASTEDEFDLFIRVGGLRTAIYIY